ncbi:MAG: hypothetical protein J5I91_02405 [Bacteroidetes bacterium]|nr:hypothetical protein [Bacteroidota bacterium]
MTFSKYFFGVILLGFIAFSGCKDKEQDAALLIPRTNQFFSFTENTQWIYDVISDSTKLSETYTLKNKIRGIRDDENSEFVSYDLVLNNEYKINVRCEVGPSQFADRIAFTVEEGSQKTVSAFLWSQSHRFYAENNDEIKNLGADTLNGIAYEEVWQLKTKRNGDFKEIKFAKGYGLIYVCFNNGKMIALKELKK